MRCPKCHYISFEPGDRCRNCGYEFSLATPDGGRPSPLDELPLHDIDATPHPPIDLSFVNTERAATPQVSSASGEAPRLAESRPLMRQSPPDRDLPLFGRATVMPDLPDSEDAPLVRPPAVPRAPLSVRRAMPEAQRIRSRYPVAESPLLDLEPATSTVDDAVPQTIGAPALVDAPPARRLVAAIIDLGLVGAINLGVLYFTLKLCTLPLSAASLLELPPVPFLGFLLLMDAGYAVVFTAIVGQTIGKMATGLKVVISGDLSASNHPNMGFSILRTAAYAASLLPLGLGFLPAFVGSDRRALHDRLADTRVVRAS